jgi:hypothetical protein
MVLRLMAVRVRVNVVTVAVHVGVEEIWRGCIVSLRHRSQKAPNVSDPEHDQHHADGEFHAKAKSRRNDQVEEDDCGSDQEDRYGVPESPESADQCRSRELLLTAENGGDSNDVVGIGCVAHAEEKAERDDRKKTDHYGIQTAMAARMRDLRTRKSQNSDMPCSVLAEVLMTIMPGRTD